MARSGGASHTSPLCARRVPSTQPVSLPIISVVRGLRLPGLPRRRLQQQVGSKPAPSIAGLMPALQAVSVCPEREGKKGREEGGPGVGGSTPHFSTYQLRTAPDEGQKLEVIQAPHTLAAGRFHPVRLLELPHNLKVPAPEGGEGRVGSKKQKDKSQPFSQWSRGD